MAFTEQGIEFRTVRPGWHQGEYRGFRINLEWERMQGGWDITVTKWDAERDISVDQIGSFYADKRSGAVIKAKKLIDQWYTEALR